MVIFFFMLRNKVLNIIQDRFSYPENTCKNIEISIYNWALEYANSWNIDKDWDNYLFKHVYIMKSMTLIKNMQLYPEKVNEMIQQKESKRLGSLSFLDFQNDESEENKETVVEESDSGLFKCMKCKSNNTTYYSLQTRSADEPMTNFITCKNCGNRWKN